MRLIGTVLIAITMILSFQNCSDVSFSSASDPAPNSDDGNGKKGNEGLNDDDFIPGQTYTLEYEVNETNKVDILFVLDTSGSMEEEHQSIGAAFDGFIASLSGLDWRVAVTIMDIFPSSQEQGANGTLVPIGGFQFIDASTPNSQSIFQTAVQRPINCHVNNTNCNEVERGTYNVNKLLDRIAASPSIPDNFIRQGSHFNVVFVSDEDVKSSGQNLETYDLPQKLIANVQQTLNPQSFTAHSIITIPGDSGCKNTGGNYGDIYNEISTLTKGNIGSVCVKPYTQHVQDIGQTIVAKQNTISLPCYPVPSSLQVTVMPGNDPWRLDGNQLVFDGGIPNGTKVTAKFTCSNNPTPFVPFSLNSAETINAD